MSKKDEFWEGAKYLKANIGEFFEIPEGGNKKEEKIWTRKERDERIERKINEMINGREDFTKKNKIINDSILKQLADMAKPERLKETKVLLTELEDYQLELLASFEGRSKSNFVTQEIRKIINKKNKKIK